MFTNRSEYNKINKYYSFMYMMNVRPKANFIWDCVSSESFQRAVTSNVRSAMMTKN